MTFTFSTALAPLDAALLEVDEATGEGGRLQRYGFSGPYNIAAEREAVQAHTLAAWELVDADYIRIPPTELSAGSVFQPRTPPNCLRVKSTILANASELKLGYFPGPSVELFVHSPILANSRGAPPPVISAGLVNAMDAEEAAISKAASERRAAAAAVYA